MKKTNVFRRIIAAIGSLFNNECTCEECIEHGAEKGIFCYKDEGRTKEMLNYPEVIKLLKTYDQSRTPILEEMLGYEDSRINTFNFIQFKKYLGHVENLSKRANIEMTGISFVSVAKPDNNGGKGYASLLYIPSTTVNGSQILFDPLQSLKEGKLVTFKEMLERHGYRWIYDSAEDYKEGKRKDNDYGLKTEMKRMMAVSNSLVEELEDESSAGDYAHYSPPY